MCFLTKNLFKNDDILMINTIQENSRLHVCKRWSKGWLFVDYSNLSNLGARYLKSKLNNSINKAKPWTLKF